MKLTVYPNLEFRVQLGKGPGAPRSADKNAVERERKAGRKILTMTRDGKAVPLDISRKSSQPKRAGSLRGGISRVARAKIRQSAGVFDWGNRRSQIFCTITLPGSTDEAMLALAKRSGQFVKAIQTYLPRGVGVKAGELKYLWVWELQKRGALHMHMVIEASDRKTANRCRVFFRRIAVQVLRAIDAAEGVKVDLFARRYGGTWKDRESAWQIDAQPVRKSAGRYLSKYLSKATAGGSQFNPSRWWGCSSSLRRERNAVTAELSSWNSVVIPPDMSVAPIRAAIKDWLSGLGLSGEVRPTRELRSDRIDLIGFFPEGFSVKEVFLSMVDLLESVTVPGYSGEKAIVPLGGGESDKSKEKVDRLVRAFYRCPYWFQERVNAELKKPYPDIRNWWGVSLEVAFDLRHFCNSELWFCGYTQSFGNLPRWAKSLYEATLLDEGS